MFNISVESVLSRLAYATVDMLVVALVVWTICAVLRPHSARLRSLLWLLVPAKGLFALVIGSSIILWGQARESDVESVVAPMVTTAQPASVPIVSSPGVAVPALQVPQEPTVLGEAPSVSSSATWTAGQVGAALWAFGALFFLALSVRDRIRGARLVRNSSPGETSWLVLVERHAAVLGVRAPSIRGTTELASPALVGVLRPVILVPDWLHSSESIDWAVRHELMHLTMRDHWAALVRELGRIAFFFHPAIWLAGRKWAEASELACDRAIVRGEDDSLDYAECLHSMAARVCRRRDPVLAHGLFAVGSEVGRRIEVLAKPPVGRARLSRRAGTAVALLFASALIAGAGTADFVRSDPDFEFSGKVVAPDGKPVSGAKVVASVWNKAEQAILIRVVRTGADGHFKLGYDKTDLPFDYNKSAFWETVSLSAHVQGFGAGWVLQRELKSLSGITLKLVADYALRGRLVDGDGQPLAGALVRGLALMASGDESLADWHAELKGGSGLQKAFASLERELRFPGDTAPSTRTNKKGEFVLNGIGRERLAWLQFFGGDAALGNARMVTRVVDSELMARVNKNAFDTVHSSGAVVVGRRSRPIEGVVRDAKTGKPMASVDVFSQTITAMGMAMGDGHTLRAKTDAKGRFRLTGMPKGKGNELVVVPGDDEPYFMREVRIPNPKGMAPIQLEISLNRGVWITGKVVDGATGRPGKGRVTYFPDLSNPLVLKIDQFKDRQIDGYAGRYRTKSDGTFRIVGLSGGGVVGVEAWGQYRSGVGCDPSWKLNEQGWLQVLTRGDNKGPGPAWPSAMCRVNVPADAVAVDCKLTLDAGQTVMLDLVDPQGKPVAGFAVRGAGKSKRTQKVEGARCEVRLLGPTEKRLVVVQIPRRNLGAVTRVSVDGDPRRGLTVGAMATIRGRLVDQDGVPVSRSMLSLYFMPERSPVNLHAGTDKNGAFTIEGVLPGSDYRIYLDTGKSLVQVGGKVQITAGKKVDLGVVKLKMP